jgi:hypothetical protein
MSQLLLSPPRLPSRTRTNFAEQQPDSSAVSRSHPDAKTEADKDAGSKAYVNTPRPEDAVSRRFAASGGRELTLDERISKVWEGILAAGAADCPVCRGRMERMGEVARCFSCNSTLS